MDLLKDLDDWLASFKKQKKPARNLALEKAAEALPIPMGGQITHEGVPIPLHDRINAQMPLLMQQLNKEPGIPSSNPQTTMHRSPWEYVEKGIPKKSLEDMFLERQGKGYL